MFLLTICHCLLPPKQGDSTLQATANQLTEKLEQIKAEAGDGQPPDIEEQTSDKPTSDKPVTNSESGAQPENHQNLSILSLDIFFAENTPDQTAATVSDLGTLALAAPALIYRYYSTFIIAVLQNQLPKRCQQARTQVIKTFSSPFTMGYSVKYLLCFTWV